MEREVDVRERVPGPFDRVCQILEERRNEIVGEAAGRVGSRQAELSVTKAGTKVGRRIAVEVGPLRREEGAARQSLRWRAAERPRLFPSMEAELRVVPVVGEASTELRLVGRYRPPLGVLGAVGDAVVGAPLAQASVRDFLRDVARRVAEELVRRSRSVSWGPVAPPYGPSLRDP